MSVTRIAAATTYPVHIDVINGMDAPVRVEVVDLHHHFGTLMPDRVGASIPLITSICTG